MHISLPRSKRVRTSQCDDHCPCHPARQPPTDRTLPHHNTNSRGGCVMSVASFCCFSWSRKSAVGSRWRWFLGVGPVRSRLVSRSPVTCSPRGWQTTVVLPSRSSPCVASHTELSRMFVCYTRVECRVEFVECEWGGGEAGVASGEWEEEEEEKQNVTHILSRGASETPPWTTRRPEAPCLHPAPAMDTPGNAIMTR